MRWFGVASGVMAAVAMTASASPPSPLDPLVFLLGEWQAQGSGAPGSSVGGFTFTRELQDRVIVRRSFSETTTTPPGQSGARHDDLMIIHVDDAGALRADYYDSEGHTIRYVVAATAGREAVFVSESMESTSSYRLTYTLAPDGSLQGKFEIAFPDRPDLFAQYLTWTARRSSEKDAPAHP